MSFISKLDRSHWKVYVKRKACRACEHRITHIGEIEAGGRRVGRCDAIAGQPTCKSAKQDGAECGHDARLFVAAASP